MARTTSLLLPLIPKQSNALHLKDSNCDQLTESSPPPTFKSVKFHYKEKETHFSGLKNSLEKFFSFAKSADDTRKKKNPGEKVFLGGCPGNNLGVGVGVGVGVGGLST